MMNALAKEKLPKPCWDEHAAYRFFEDLRWGDSPTCPRCGDADVYAVMSRSGTRCSHHRWCCRSCRKQYTVRKGTVMEESRLPLRVWCYACWAVCATDGGASPLHLARQARITSRSARYLLSRIQHAIAMGT
jgi:transposase-like protein